MIKKTLCLLLSIAMMTITPMYSTDETGANDPRPNLALNASVSYSGSHEANPDWGAAFAVDGIRRLNQTRLVCFIVVFRRVVRLAPRAQAGQVRIVQLPGVPLPQLFAGGMHGGPP